MSAKTIYFQIFGGKNNTQNTWAGRKEHTVVLGAKTLWNSIN